MHRRVGLKLSVTAFASIFSLSAAAGQVEAGGPDAGTVAWITAFAAPETLPDGSTSDTDVTVRQRFRFETDGSQVRIVLNNAVGTGMVVARDIHIGLLDDQNNVIAGTDRVLTFSQNGVTTGQVTLSGTKSVTSDPVALNVSREQIAAVSIYYPAAATTFRAGIAKEAFVTTGDHAGDATFPSSTVVASRNILHSVDVKGSTATKVLVAIGDSITAGYKSTPYAHKSYPEQVTDLFGATAAGRAWSVLNMGISGNRVLRDDYGPCLLSRFNRDALGIAGVTGVLVLEGINDIGSAWKTGGLQNVTSDQLIAAYRQLIVGAHAKQVRIYFGTILPYGRASYYSSGGEEVRVAVDNWVRTNQEADGYIEMAEPLQTTGADGRLIIKPALTDGGLHPNDDGYAIMAQQVHPATINSSTSRAEPGGVSASAACLSD